jgi:hypothetical protein
MSEHIDNPSLWKLLLVLTAVIGITVTVLVLDKEHYFPTLYASHGDLAGTPHPDSMANEETSAHEIPSSERVEEVKKEETILPPEVLPSEVPAGNYVLVAGSFLSEDYARKFQSTLQEKISEVQPEVVTVTVDSATYYRVVALRSTKETVSSMKGMLENAGFTQSWVYEKLR